MTDSRKKFEAAAKLAIPYLHFDLMDGEYFNELTGRVYKLWQACDSTFATLEAKNAELAADYLRVMTERDGLRVKLVEAMEQEKEACAKVCETWRNSCESRSMQAEGYAAQECADAIRSHSSE